MNKIKSRTKEVAIIAIAVLEGIALHQGIDGTLFSVVIAVIAGLAGYSVRVIKEK